MERINFIYPKSDVSIAETPSFDRKVISYFPMYKIEASKPIYLNIKKELILSENLQQETSKEILIKLKKELAKIGATPVFEKMVKKDNWVWDDDYFHLVYKLENSTPQKVNSIMKKLNKKLKLLENKIWLTIQRF